MRISIKGARKIVSTFVGTLQSTLGALAVILSYFLYSNLFGLRESFEVPAEFLPVYMLILTVFGFFSIISGLFLLTESSGSP